MVGRPSFWSVGGALVLFALAGSAAAQDRLTAQGVVLSPVKVNPANAVVQRTVQLDSGDAVAVTHVSLRTADGKYLQRNNEGYWVPWSGVRDTLIDNRLQPVGNLLTFKVLKQDISGQSFPLTVSISYGSPGALKFGIFEVLPQ
jgi:hypothetical protein